MTRATRDGHLARPLAGHDVAARLRGKWHGNGCMPLQPQLQQRMGKLGTGRSINGRYNQDAGGIAYALPAAFRTSPRDSARVRYKISIVANSLTANGYVLQAVPVDATDACGTYTLDQAGTRLNTVGANPAAYLQNCWER